MASEPKDHSPLYISLYGNTRTVTSPPSETVQVTVNGQVPSTPETTAGSPRGLIHIELGSPTLTVVFNGTPPVQAPPPVI